jgi:hypothetical protein
VHLPINKNNFTKINNLAMIYNLDEYQPQNQGFSWSELGETIGDTATSVIGGFGANTDANAINALAIANLNKAQADAIKSNAENRRQITRNIFMLLVIAIIAIVAVSIATKFLGK